MRSLLRWLRETGQSPASVEPLSGDVSPRRYYRVELEDGETRILAVYPGGLTETCRRFLKTSAILKRASVRVPAVYGSDCERGLMLLEDLGEKTLYDLREDPWVELLNYLDAAIEDLLRIRQLPVGQVERLNPFLDGEALRSELDRSWDLLLARDDVTGSAVLRDELRQALDEVCGHLHSAPLVPCHRDFMARNLMVLSGTTGLGVLDHQDLRLGPSFYDLASLLNDSLFPPSDIEKRLRGRLATSAEEIDLYRRCAVQRTLKAAGTFEAFARRGSNRHLPLIAPTLARARDHLRRLPEGRHLPDDLFARASSYSGPRPEPGEC